MNPKAQERLPRARPHTHPCGQEADGCRSVQEGRAGDFTRLQDSLSHGASETQEPMGNDTSGHDTVWKAYTMSHTGLSQLLEVRRRAMVEDCSASACCCSPRFPPSPWHPVPTQAPQMRAYGLETYFSKLLHVLHFHSTLRSAMNKVVKLQGICFCSKYQGITNSHANQGLVASDLT